MSSDERGQASVEWIGLLLLVSMALAAALALAPAIDGRPLGAAIARALVCAVKGDCHADGAALRRAYGEGDAALVRKQAPNVVYERRTLTLPVDYRRCRSHRCSDAPDDRDLDVHRSARGLPATAFTHVVHRGGRTYIQYWLYYPDSVSTFAHSALVQKALHLEGLDVPGLGRPIHPDDWEGYQVRIEADGSTSVRATKHGDYTSCKGHIWHNKCERWGAPNGWTRVSYGSHAGHIPERTPGTGLRERSTTAPGIRLVPLETLDHDTYKPLEGGIDPPWTKEVYRRPESGSS
jgi:hypothetical protein